MKNKIILASVLSPYFLFMLGCGKIEKSSYSGQENAPAKSTSPKEKISLVKPKPPELKDSDVLASERDPTFNTGLDVCVKEGLISKDLKPHMPLALSQADQDWTNRLTEITPQNFWTVYDAVVRTLVSPEEGLVSYSRIRSGGDLEAVWVEIAKSLASSVLPQAAQSDAEKIAFWVNTYNLIMIDILRLDPTALVGAKRTKTFDALTRKVANLDVTLNTIEYKVLRLGGGRSPDPTVPSESLPTGLETRLHVALVCGAVSCPKLRNFAYEAKQLDKILNENIHMFVNSQAKHLKWNAELKQPQFSALFSWFAGDFNFLAMGTKPADLGRFILPQCRSDGPEIMTFLNNLGSFADLSAANKLPYNWNVNER
jgi:Protein of unknown function, DUF547